MFILPILRHLVSTACGAVLRTNKNNKEGNKMNQNLYQVTSQSNKHLKLAFSLAALLCAHTSLASDIAKLACNDTSYANNEASIIKVNNAYEIAIGGSQLNGTNLRTMDGLEFKLGGLRGGLLGPSLSVLARVPLEACEVSENELTVKCSVNFSGDFTQAAYISWIQSDIDHGFLKPIVRAEFPGTRSQKLEFVISNNSAALTMSGFDARYNETRRSVVSIPVCLTSTEHVNANRFPERLRAFLDSGSK